MSKLLQIIFKLIINFWVLKNHSDDLFKIKTFLNLFCSYKRKMFSKILKSSKSKSKLFYYAMIKYYRD